MPHSGAADRLQPAPDQAADASRADLDDARDPVAARTEAAEPAPVKTPDGSAVVATWPATSNTRLPVCVSYVDIRSDAGPRPSAS
jgi:hypothetical protein